MLLTLRIIVDSIKWFGGGRWSNRIISSRQLPAHTRSRWFYWFIAPLELPPLDVTSRLIDP